MQMVCDTDRIVLNLNRFRHESAFTQLMKRVEPAVNSPRRCHGAVRAHTIQPGSSGSIMEWSECSVSQCPCVRALQSSSGHPPPSDSLQSIQLHHHHYTLYSLHIQLYIIQYCSIATQFTLYN